MQLRKIRSTERLRVLVQLTELVRQRQNLNASSQSPEAGLIWQPRNEVSHGKANKPAKAAQLAVVGRARGRLMHAWTRGLL